MASTQDGRIASLMAGIIDRIAAGRPADGVERCSEHIPSVPRPATIVEASAAERALGFELPPLLRRLYLEIANGGFGPGYGLEGVPTIPPTLGAADILVLYRQFSAPLPAHPRHVWPRGLIPLISRGCLQVECVDFLRPPYRVVLFDGNSSDLDQPTGDSMTPIAPALLDRLESWVLSPD